MITREKCWRWLREWLILAALFFAVSYIMRVLGWMHCHQVPVLFLWCMSLISAGGTMVAVNRIVYHVAERPARFYRVSRSAAR